MNPISSVSSSVSQQTIAALQAQMARYSQAANGRNSQASSDYKALQSAIQSGNVSAAQSALARLQRDSRTTNPAAPTPAPAAPAAHSPAVAAQPWIERSINKTA